MSNWNNNTQPAPTPYPTSPHPQPPRHTRKSFPHVVGYVVALCLGGIFGVLVGISLNTNTASSFAEPETTVTSPAPKPKSVAEKPKAAATTFGGNGTYQVNKDIKPGRYKSNGELCYWARLSSLDGDLLSIITNSVGGGPQVVTIKKSDKGFKTQGCNTWTPAK